MHGEARKTRARAISKRLIIGKLRVMDVIMAFHWGRKQSVSFQLKGWVMCSFLFVTLAPEDLPILPD